MGKRLKNKSENIKNKQYCSKGVHFRIVGVNSDILEIETVPITIFSINNEYCPELMLNIYDHFESYEDSEEPGHYFVSRDYAYSESKFLYCAEYLINLRGVFGAKVNNLKNSLNEMEKTVWTKTSIFHPDLFRGIEPKDVYPNLINLCRYIANPYLHYRKDELAKVEAENPFLWNTVENFYKKTILGPCSDRKWLSTFESKKVHPVEEEALEILGAYHGCRVLRENYYSGSQFIFEIPHT